MTDEEIINGLERCIKDKCLDCPFSKTNACITAMATNALDLINRQKAEIERLQNKVESLAEILSNTIRIRKNEVRTEAINEFAERLKKELSFGKYIQADQIDNLVKEMVVEDESRN